MESEIHLGKLIRQELNRQKRSVTWLADIIKCDRTNCYNIFNRQYIDIELLKRISRALKHNFFNELARNMDYVVKDATDM
ncbi:MAG: XRE family transcriptional regulator [Bacteroidales bacterium]|nr:XRE family transcriptional regulator [Bacteroidales bacterium]